MNRELLKKIGGLPGGQKDPFEDPYGPTPNCFSANDIVRMFDLGALRRDMDHLKVCPEKKCLERVKRYAQVTGAKMLLHIPSAVQVTPDETVEPVRIHIMNILALEGQSEKLHLDGPVIAECAMPAPGADWVEVRFDDARVSPDVLKLLKKHHRVTDQVMLRAGTVKQIVATSNIELHAKF